MRDNEARREIEHLRQEIRLLRQDMISLCYLEYGYSYRISVRETVSRILEHHEMKVVYKPGDTVLVNREE